MAAVGSDYFLPHPFSQTRSLEAILRQVFRLIFGVLFYGSLFAESGQSQLILSNETILSEKIASVESYGVILVDQKVIHYNILDSLITEVPTIAQKIMEKTDNSSVVNDAGTYRVSVGSARNPVQVTTNPTLLDYHSLWVKYTNDSRMGLSTGINYSLPQKQLLFDVALIWGKSPDLFSEYQVGYQFGTGSYYQTGKFRMNTTLEYTRVFDPKIARTEEHRSRGRNLLDAHASLHITVGHKQNVLLITGLRYRLLSDSVYLPEKAFIPYIGIGTNFLKAG